MFPYWFMRKLWEKRFSKSVHIRVISFHENYPTLRVFCLLPILGRLNLCFIFNLFLRLLHLILTLSFGSGDETEESDDPQQMCTVSLFCLLTNDPDC